MHAEKTILICPLNWGLGHASRVIPIIKALRETPSRLIIGADKAALYYLRQEFPELETIRIPDLNIRYSRIMPAWMAVMLRTPCILYSLIREHLILKNILCNCPASVIISDNRYGLWSKKTRNIIITHQLAPKLPGAMGIFERPLSRIISLLALRFDACWIPDFEGENNLTGSLSHGIPTKTACRFIGPLSRFSCLDMKPTRTNGPSEGTGSITKISDPALQGDQSGRYELIVVVSGPEPQRTRFMDILLEQIPFFSLRALIVAGEPRKNYSYIRGSNCRIVSHLRTGEFNRILRTSPYVISRAGYSSIMELALMRKKALLVPTPGQTEQIYLSEYLRGKGIFPFMIQSRFSIREALMLLDTFPFKQDFPVNTTALSDLL